MKYLLLGLMTLPLMLTGCAQKEPERQVPKPYVEREVLYNQGGAFNSCPPAHREQGRC